MSQSANTLETLNGLFKDVYASQVEQLIPENYKMINLVKFNESEKQGKQFVQAVILNSEHGVTFAGPNDDVYALNAPISGGVKDALVKGYQMLLRSQIGYASISRSEGGGKKAFKDATKVVVENMMRSFSKKLEIRLMYGQMGLGTVAAKSGSVITITTAEFASGIWVGGENMALQIRNAAGTAVTQEASLQNVTLNSRQITLDQQVAPAVSVGDVIWEKGSYGKEMPGLHKIMTNTGLLFDIDASQYSLWQSNSYDCSAAALSFGKIQEAIALPVGKGLEDDVTLLISPATWASLMTDEAALRKYDVSYDKNKTENGSRVIEYFSQNGAVKIIPSIYCKEGYAYLFGAENFMRIGSCDITFKRPGRGNEEFFRELENSAGYELRIYTDQSLFTYCPGKSCLLFNIVN